MDMSSHVGLVRHIRFSMQRIFKPINVYSVADYFKLSKKNRTKLGLYLLPVALPSEILNDEPGWSEWSRRIKQEFPVQWWIREWFLSHSNPIYHIIVRARSWLIRAYHSMYRILKPCIPRTRKSIPRHKYVEVTEAIRDINFSLILDFWYEEVDGGIVDYTATEQHKQFYSWLQASVFWIERARPDALVKLEAELIATNKKDSSCSYTELYGNYDKLERLIETTDNKILLDLIKYRSFFWT